jgi:peptidoglycan/LPS O-acetylase OafA/YrhL
MDVWSLFLFIVFFASIPLASEMARKRARSRRLWFWIALLVGTLAPLILFVLGDRGDGEANHA